MPKPAPPIPPGHAAVQTYMVVPDAKAAIDFYKKAFDAEQVALMSGPDGKVMHAEIKIADSYIYMTDENPAWGAKSAKTMGGSPISMHLHTKDVDAAFKKAISAGAKEIMPVADVFWGDRYGKLEDPFGYQWGIATQRETLTEEEIGKAAQEFFAQMKQ